MKTTIDLTVPFDFQATITTLQRGPDDPVNLVDQQIWQRCFQINGESNLLSVHFDQGVQIAQLSGQAKKENIEALISHCLGLDDPLLMETASDDRIHSAWGIAVPGYPSLFEALVQTLFGQLVSVPVANQMRRRFVLAFGKSYEHDDRTGYIFPEAHVIARLNEEDLKVIGTSQMKIRSILAVARAFADDGIEEKLHALQDREEQYRLLQALYGVGRWTIDWIMLRALRQFDVVPDTDLAVRKAVTWWVKSESLLSAKETLDATKVFSPYAGAMIYRILCAYVKNQFQQKLLV